MANPSALWRREGWKKKGSRGKGSGGRESPSSLSRHPFFRGSSSPRNPGQETRSYAPPPPPPKKEASPPPRWKLLRPEKQVSAPPPGRWGSARSRDFRGRGRHEPTQASAALPGATSKAEAHAVLWTGHPRSSQRREAHLRSSGDLRIHEGPPRQPETCTADCSILVGALPRKPSSTLPTQPLAFGRDLPSPSQSQHAKGMTHKAGSLLPGHFSPPVDKSHRLSQQSSLGRCSNSSLQPPT